MAFPLPAGMMPSGILMASVQSSLRINPFNNSFKRPSPDTVSYINDGKRQNSVYEKRRRYQLGAKANKRTKRDTPVKSIVSASFLQCPAAVVVMTCRSASLMEKSGSTFFQTFSAFFVPENGLINTTIFSPNSINKKFGTLMNQSDATRRN
jgi:hypothetical protein